MGMAYVCSRNVWNAGVLSGPGPRAAPFRPHGRSAPCSWKGSTGGSRYAPGVRSCRCKGQSGDSASVSARILFEDRVRGILPEMATARAALPDLDTLDAEALKALVLAQH